MDAVRHDVNPRDVTSVLSIVPLVSEGKAKPLLVCLSHLRWNFVFQRPQHLMTRFARAWDVIFFEEPVIQPIDAPRLEQQRDASGVIVAVPVLPEGLSEQERIEAQRRLLDELLSGHEQRDVALWYYTPMALPYSRHLRRSLCVYDCMDELSNFHGAPTGLARMEAELFRDADLVFTGGHSLYEAKRDRHRSVHAYPSSVDTAHFRRAREAFAEPADQAHLPHPRIGFFGVIDERLDIELLAAVAAARPDWQLVVVGPVVKIDPAILPRADNIHYLGGKKYDELPSYLAGWDLAMMPFARNDATRFISPTKTPEYLAAGRPVISTSIRDVVRPYGEQGLVAIADTAEEFVAAAEALLARGEQDRTAWLHQVDAFLAQQSWDRTWGNMLEQMQTVLERSPSQSARGLGAQGPRLTAANVAGRIGSRRQPISFDWLIVGAGFAGSVLAERLARGADQTVLLIDKRPHIGGNAYDCYDSAGILIHKYGPHIFHTNSAEVFEYLSQFTEWRPYEHRVLARVDGMLLPIPINLDTVNRLYGLDLDGEQLEAFFAERAEPRARILTSEDVVVSRVGRDLYEKFFRGYTRKQWGVDPSDLDKSVTARVPTRTNRDDRYFTDAYQYMPAQGYTRMFENMLDHPNIKIMLNTDYQEVRDLVPYRRLIYTGPIDEYFDFRLGRLPYRSLHFRHTTLDKEWHQPVAVVNYPQDQTYTRVTEYKHLTGQTHPRTSLTYEYPSNEGDPYYPVPRPENAALFKRYEALADAEGDVTFVGRLATYRYYNMDQVVAQALATFAKLTGSARQGWRRRPAVEGDAARSTA